MAEGQIKFGLTGESYFPDYSAQNTWLQTYGTSLTDQNYLGLAGSGLQFMTEGQIKFGLTGESYFPDYSAQNTWLQTYGTSLMDQNYLGLAGSGLKYMAEGQIKFGLTGESYFPDYSAKNTWFQNYGAGLTDQNYLGLVGSGLQFMTEGQFKFGSTGESFLNAYSGLSSGLFESGSVREFAIKQTDELLVNENQCIEQPSAEHVESLIEIPKEGVVDTGDKESVSRNELKTENEVWGGDYEDISSLIGYKSKMEISLHGEEFRYEFDLVIGEKKKTLKFNNAPKMVRKLLDDPTGKQWN